MNEAGVNEAEMKKRVEGQTESVGSENKKIADPMDRR